MDRRTLNQALNDAKWDNMTDREIISLADLAIDVAQQSIPEEDMHEIVRRLVTEYGIKYSDYNLLSWYYFNNGYDQGLRAGMIKGVFTTIIVVLIVGTLIWFFT